MSTCDVDGPVAETERAMHEFYIAQVQYYDAVRRDIDQIALAHRPVHPPVTMFWFTVVLARICALLILFNVALNILYWVLRALYYVRQLFSSFIYWLKNRTPDKQARLADSFSE